MPRTLKRVPISAPDVVLLSCSDPDGARVLVERELMFTGGGMAAAASRLGCSMVQFGKLVDRLEMKKRVAEIKRECKTRFRIVGSGST